jgi:hypothetical protein
MNNNSEVNTVFGKRQSFQFESIPTNRYLSADTEIIYEKSKYSLRTYLYLKQELPNYKCRDLLSL